VVCTDGVFEAIDSGGNAFSWERLRQTIAAAGGDATSVHDRLRDAIDRHAGDEPPSDDRTLVVAERLPPLPG